MDGGRLFNGDLREGPHGTVDDVRASAGRLPPWSSQIMDSNQRMITVGAALIACFPALTARAATELNGDQIVVAMAVDTALFAAEKCFSCRRGIGFRQRTRSWR